MALDLISLIIIGVVILIILALSIRIVNQYERGVVFDRSYRSAEGLRLIIPLWMGWLNLHCR